MSRPFHSNAKKAKNVFFFFFFFFLTLFISRDFSGTIAGTNIINTPPEPSRPTDVRFVGYKTESKDLGGVLAAKSISACSGAI